MGTGVNASVKTGRRGGRDGTLRVQIVALRAVVFRRPLRGDVVASRRVLGADDVGYLQHKLLVSVLPSFVEDDPLAVLRGERFPAIPSEQLSE